MAKVILNIPEINYQFKTPSIDYSQTHIKNGNVDTLNNIKANYSTYIDSYGTFFSIPSGLIASFIATESNGRNVAPNKYKATGLMQVTPNAFMDSLKNRLNAGLVSTEHIALIKRNIPNISISGKSVKSSTSSIEANILIALQKPEFNIYAGCLYINYLINRFAISGVAQLNKTLVGYNAGAFNKVISNAILIPVDSTALSKNVLVPKESRGYLVKMLGIDGFLDLIYRQRLVTFSS